MTNNKWSEMSAAEWRGKVGEKIERLEVLLASVCAKVDTHDKALAVIEDRNIRARIGWRGWAGIISAIILSLGSIAVALMK